MLKCSCLAIISIALVFSVRLSADDITLKSGEKIENVKVLKKTEKYWRIELVDGNKKRIAPGDVATHVAKATVGDELTAKTKKLGRRDLAGYLALAKEAQSVGATRHAKKLFNKVVKLDKNHTEARAALGFELGDDLKWRSGKALEKFNRGKVEKKLKAQGWVKRNGQFVPPYDAKCIDAGLVKHESAWHSKSDVKKLKAGMFFLEGNWYEKSDRLRLDNGERMVEGQWATIADLDKTGRQPDSPWVVESEHFVVQAPLSHRTIMVLIKQLEANWEPMFALFGDGPVIASRDDKIKIQLHKNVTDYRAVSPDHTVAGNDRVSLYSSTQGAFYSPRTKTVLGYYHSPDYLCQWIQHSTTHAFLDRLTHEKGLQSNMFEAIGAYFQCMFEGKFQPYNAIWSNGLLDWKADSPRKVLNKFVLDHHGKTAKQVEGDFGRIGFAFHYLLTKHPTIVKDWMRNYIKGSAAQIELVEAIEEAAGGDATEEFNAFLKDFLTKYEQPTL